MNAGEIARNRYIDAMKTVEVGAQLVRRSRAWVIVESVRRETSVDLTLRHGRRSIVVSVMVCLRGPCLHDVDLKPAAAAPTQRTLGFDMSEGAA